jgi:hypothetical protein
MGEGRSEMKWIELIRVRSSAARLEEAMPSMQQQVDEIRGSTRDAETFFLQHALYDGDLAVVVVWKGASTPQKSREGLMLAERLQGLGSIDHAVWVPAHE